MTSNVRPDPQTTSGVGLDRTPENEDVEGHRRAMKQEPQSDRVVDEVEGHSFRRSMLPEPDTEGVVDEDVEGHSHRN